jgi:hypothetical protein
MVMIKAGRVLSPLKLRTTSENLIPIPVALTIPTIAEAAVQRQAIMISECPVDSRDFTSFRPASLASVQLLRVTK